MSARRVVRAALCSPAPISAIRGGVRLAVLAVLARLACFATAAGAVGCVRAPSPLNPAIHGSIGTTSNGFLTEGEPVADAAGTRWLRNNGRHYGIPRFVHAIERAADEVARERPGSILVTGNLLGGARRAISHHLSHASGRDADLLLYLETLDGEPIAEPGLPVFEADGLAWDASTIGMFASTSSASGCSSARSSRTTRRGCSGSSSATS